MKVTIDFRHPTELKSVSITGVKNVPNPENEHSAMMFSVKGDNGAAIHVPYSEILCIRVTPD